MDVLPITFSDGLSTSIKRSSDLAKHLKTLPYLQVILGEMSMSEVSDIKLPVDGPMGISFLYFLGHRHPGTYYPNDFNSQAIRIIRALIVAYTLYAGDTEMMLSYIESIRRYAHIIAGYEFISSFEETFYSVLYYNTRPFDSENTKTRDEAIYRHFYTVTGTLHKTISFDTLNMSLDAVLGKLLIWATTFLSFEFLMQKTLAYPVKRVKYDKHRYVIRDGANSGTPGTTFDTTTYDEVEQYALNLMYLKYIYYIKYPITRDGNENTLQFSTKHSEVGTDLIYLYDTYIGNHPSIAHVLLFHTNNAELQAESRDLDKDYTVYTANSEDRLTWAWVYRSLVHVLDYLYHFDSYDEEVLKLYSKFLPLMNGVLEPDSLNDYGKWATAATYYMPLDFFGRIDQYSRQNDLGDTTAIYEYNMFGPFWLRPPILLGMISQRLTGHNLFPFKTVTVDTLVESTYQWTIYPFNMYASVSVSLHAMCKNLDEDRFRDDTEYAIIILANALTYTGVSEMISTIVAFSILFTFYDMTPEVENIIKANVTFRRSVQSLFNVAGNGVARVSVQAYFNRLKTDIANYWRHYTDAWFTKEFIKNLKYGVPVPSVDMVDFVGPTTILPLEAVIDSYTDTPVIANV